MRIVHAPGRRAARRPASGRGLTWRTAAVAVLLLATACHHGSAAKVSSSSSPVSRPSPSRAAAAAPVPPPTVSWLIGALQNVGLATAKFGLHDNLGCPMATLKIVDSAG